MIMQEDAAIITAVKSLEASESECHIYGSVNKEVDVMVDTTVGPHARAKPLLR